MNVHQLIEFMGSMMNAREDIISNCGKHSLIVSIVCLLLLLLMKKYSVCMEDYLQSYLHLIKSKEL